MERYDLCGLTLDSELELSARPSIAGAVDVSVRLAERKPVPEGPNEGWVILAQSDVGRGRIVARTARGYCLRLFGVCDFEIDATASNVTVRPDPSVNPEFVAILAAGNLVAVLLTLRGAFPLHASTICWDDSAVAFVAASGMGKSTLAAALCAQGACLVTDDVLRFSDGPTGTLCALGHVELRLRPHAARLVDGIGHSRQTCDGRLAWRPERLAVRPPQLGCIVLPNLNRAADRCTIRRLSERDAVFALAQFPRVLGWQHAEVRALQFRSLARIGRSVPVLEAELPWSDSPLPHVDALMSAVSTQCPHI